MIHALERKVMAVYNVVKRITKQRLQKTTSCFLPQNHIIAMHQSSDAIKIIIKFLRSRLVASLNYELRGIGGRRFCTAFDTTTVCPHLS